jgi:hypothetical protein
MGGCTEMTTKRRENREKKWKRRNETIARLNAINYKYKAEAV